MIIPCGFNHSLVDSHRNSVLMLCSFPSVLKQTIDTNWRCGRHVLHRILCHSENSKGVYCLQYDDQKIVSGLRDNTIKVCIYELNSDYGFCKVCQWPDTLNCNFWSFHMTEIVRCLGNLHLSTLFKKYLALLWNTECWSASDWYIGLNSPSNCMFKELWKCSFWESIFPLFKVAKVRS